MRIIIIGTNRLSREIMLTIEKFVHVKIIAMIDDGQSSSAVHELANQLHIPIEKHIDALLQTEVDYIINATRNDEIPHMYLENNQRTIVIPRQLVVTLLPLLKVRNLQLNYLKLILQHIHDGLVVIDNQELITFINDRALRTIRSSQVDVIGDNIRQIMPQLGLHQILTTRKKYVNKRMTLQDNIEVIVTSVPLIDEDNHLVGAFAIFKDSREVMQLAEENTDLRKVKTMLEAIIHSSDEAISVVDENGNGLMVNPAYTRITGLSENEVIGKPATVDISEGESVHFKVLHTRRPIKGAKIKVGPFKKEVIVNVAPIIVAGKLKGSVAIIHDITEIKQLTTELKRAKQIIRNLEATYTFADIIGSSSEMMIAKEQAKIGAKTPATVLLRGSSGTGKELFAHAIHNESDRKYHKFIRVNCAAIAESVLESELFGYESGAFTGAKAGGKKGLFEEANNGSIFLDEIGELSLTMQAKLLRVLQEQEIVRVGGTTPIALDIRIIAATNANLEKAVMQQTFREDLYYRLNRLPIYIPALHERIADLPELVQHIIMKVNQQYGRNVQTISKQALEKLTHYHWPGNIRELENVISRAIIFMDTAEEIIHFTHLPMLDVSREEQTNSELTAMPDHDSLQTAMDQYEKEYIYTIYKQNGFNKTKTAKQLQISVRSLYYKLEKYKID